MLIAFTSFYVVPFIANKSLFGAQQGSLNSLNEPPVAVVTTLVEYLVLVRTAQAVTGLQQGLNNGNAVVPSQIVMTTFALMVAVSGIA